MSMARAAWSRRGRVVQGGEKVQQSGPEIRATMLADGFRERFAGRCGLGRLGRGLRRLGRIIGHAADTLLDLDAPSNANEVRKNLLDET